MLNGRERRSGVLDRRREERMGGVFVGAGANPADAIRRGRRWNSGETMPELHLMVVDDDDAVRTACAEIGQTMGFAVVTAADIPASRTTLAHQKVDLILLDLKVPGGGGLSLLQEVKRLYPETVVIVMTAFATVASAVEAMRVGAADYLTKPFALDELTGILERGAQRRHYDLESRWLRERLRSQRGAASLIGRTPEMEKLFRMISKVAATTHPVLVLGEAGSGKELVARSIHFNGPNAQQPFVPVDCRSLMPEQMEGELFGYVQGVNGAQRAKEGLLVAAGLGTVVLDEIGELPLDLQGKVLRAMQDKCLKPMGGTESVTMRARILATTSADLQHRVDQGKFRRDLFMKLNVVSLKIPALRSRVDDIPLLAQHFMERNQKEGGKATSLSDGALRAMMEYEWPGNVRELEQALERACAMSSGPVVHMGDLPTQLHQGAPEPVAAAGEVTAEAAVGAEMEPAKPIVSIAEMEKHAILTTIRQLKGDKLTAAKLLGIGKTTLYRKLKEYGISDAEASGA